jgi:hypothetical protein
MDGALGFSSTIEFKPAVSWALPGLTRLYQALPDLAELDLA